jgi:hypothetical protein
MARKFRVDRLYNIVKIIVNIITIGALLKGIYFIANFKNLNNSYSKLGDVCIARSTDYPSMNLCEQWYNKTFNTIVFLFAIAIFLPIIFYGGGKLIGYLFPKKD